MNGGILYKSKYGSTRQYAEWLSQTLHLPILDINKVSEESVTLHDFFIIGSPMYIGKLMAANWLRRHEGILKNKKIFLFIVCGTPVSKERRIAQILGENLPQTLKKNCIVSFLPGRIVKSKLSWIDRLMLKIGSKLEKDPKVRKSMTEDFDLVEQSNLEELIESIRFFQAHPKSHIDSLYTVNR